MTTQSHQQARSCRRTQLTVTDIVLPVDSPGAASLCWCPCSDLRVLLEKQPALLLQEAGCILHRTERQDRCLIKHKAYSESEKKPFLHKQGNKAFASLLLPGTILWRWQHLRHWKSEGLAERLTMSHHTVGVRSLTSAKQHSPAGGPQVPVLIINFIFK